MTDSTHLNHGRLVSTPVGACLLVPLLLVMLLIVVLTSPPAVYGQPGPMPQEGPTVGDILQDADAAPSLEPLDLLSLLRKGGWLMVPLVVMAFAVVTLVLERLFALRRSRVIPGPLLHGLSELAESPAAMDPRRAYRLAQQYPSPASRVIHAMLLRIGRPQTEVQHAVAEASQREAARLYANVRWLNLIAAIAPLMGLFGTVWGMIRAFFDTTQLAEGLNKAEFLAQGIYVALVTTLAGLAVAIPAAIFAHFFEGRIENLFHEIDELLFAILPQIERFEGRMRVSARTLDSEPAIGGAAPQADGTVDPERAATAKPS